MSKEREDLINKTVRALVKQFGDGAACTLTKAFAPENVRGFVPSGNLALDWAVGRPGFPIGRISEIAGPYGSCKSTVVACAIGAAQKAGVVCILIDAEHSYDSSWSRRFGVVPEELIIVQPPHLEGLFDRTIATIKLVKEAQSDISVFVAVDSVSVVPTSAELEEEDSTEGKQRASHARLIAEGLRKAGDLIWNQNVSLLFVSQLKDNPGIMYGTNKSKIGGHAIEFHAGLMIELRRQGFIKGEQDRVVGQNTNIKVIKNKFVPPFREATFSLYYETGIAHKEILLDFLSEPAYGLNQITKSGGWYEFQGSKYRKEDLAAKLDISILGDVYKSLKLTPPYDRGDTVVPQEQVLEIDQTGKVTPVKEELKVDQYRLPDGTVMGNKFGNPVPVEEDQAPVASYKVVSLKDLQK